MKSWMVRYMRGYLPAYVNGTLGSVQMWILDLWLARDAALRDELNDLRGFRSIMQDQPHVTPDLSVLVRIKSAAASPRVQPRTTWRTSLIWPAIVATLVVVTIFLWRAMPPGLEISWSLEGTTPESFRIYRAPIESPLEDDFSLIGELPAQSGVGKYDYTDLRLIPGQRFLYQVEAIDGSGHTVTSQALEGNSLEAFPRQMIFVFVFIVISLGLFSTLRQLRSATWNLEQIAL